MANCRRRVSARPGFMSSVSSGSTQQLQGRWLPPGQGYWPMSPAGSGDVITALQAAGALPSSSPAPGQLA